MPSAGNVPDPVVMAVRGRCRHRASHGQQLSQHGSPSQAIRCTCGCGEPLRKRPAAEAGPCFVDWIQCINGMNAQIAWQIDFIKWRLGNISCLYWEYIPLFMGIYPLWTGSISHSGLVPINKVSNGMRTAICPWRKWFVSSSHSARPAAQKLPNTETGKRHRVPAHNEFRSNHVDQNNGAVDGECSCVHRGHRCRNRQLARVQR